MASIEEILKDKGVVKPRVTKRPDGRAAEALREVRITPGYCKHALGSCLIEMGDTRVICAANLEDRVPPHMKNTGSGWITAEYGMLPSATAPRGAREAARGKVGGRTHEIQRLIGRALRAAVNQKELGERTLWLDCDVVQADGGTRTASITGAYVALVEAIRRMQRQGLIARNPITDQVAAISVGIVEDEPVLDLNYDEDSKAEVDMNVVMTGTGRIIEVQGTAEGAPFTRAQLDDLLDLAHKGIAQLIEKQAQVLSRP